MRRCCGAVWVLACSAVLSSGGCSQSHAHPGGEGRPVSGTVTYQGQPVAGATVTFKSPLHSAVGQTDSEGKFKLVAAGRGDSVPLGNYTVTVEKLSQPVIVEAKGDEQYKIPDPNAARPSPPQDLLPVKYKADTSGLAAEVKADGANEFKFALTD